MLFRSGVSPIRFILRPSYAAVIAIALMLGGCDREKAPSGQAVDPQVRIGTAKAQPGGKVLADRSYAGKKASAAIFFGPDDRPIMLGHFQGAPVLVNLWATWCVPCVAEMPSLDKLAEARAKTMSVVAVAQDIQGAEVVDPWLDKAGLKSLKAYLDPANKLLADYNSPLPITILLDREGREVWRVTGVVDWQGAEAQALLDEGTK